MGSRTFQHHTGSGSLSPVHHSHSESVARPGTYSNVAPLTESNSGTVPVPLIPGLTRGFASKAWEQVVKDWEEADPERSLYVAMKDWEPQWHKRSNLTQKYGQRKVVALEFIDL